MAGVGSTNAMKKGSGNNPFLAYSKADMRSYLNSAYTGCIVKYTGPSTKVEVLISDKNKDAQNLVFGIANPFTRHSGGLMRYAMKIDKMTDDGVKTTYICHKWINKLTGRLQNGLDSFDESEYWVYALIEIDDINLDNIKGNNVKFLAVTESLSEIPSLIDLHQDWPTTKGINGWQTNCINEAGKITLWSYSEDVKYSYAGGSNFDASEPIYYEPYVVNELYEVVYSNGKYYFEEFYYTSDDVTTATVEDVVPGKTFYDFTGTKQTGTGTKINPYIATDLNTFKSFPIGSFIKWLGPDKTVLDETTGQVLMQGEIYRAVEDGDIFQYVILPTLSSPGTAADLAQGKQLIDGDGKIVEGEAIFSSGDYTVKVIDYDGTVLMEKKGNTGDVIDLPTAPTHDKLVFQEWSASVAVSDNKVTIDDNDIIVGAVYTTVSGQNEFDITLTKVTGLTIVLNMDGTKDWGDGTSDTTISHTYTAYGDYTIKCNGTKMTTSSNSGLFGQSSSSVNHYCTAVRFATVISIGTYAFTYCYSLTNIVISNSVTSIIGYTFYCCSSLISIVIPNSATSIGGYAFCECFSLTKIIIPNGVTSIGTYAFSGCSSLTSIVIPNSVTSIGNEAFAGIHTLTSIVISSGVKSIRDSTFSGCSSLTNIVIPNSVTSIGTTAFYACYSLISIVIPNSVTSIGERAFGNCYSLTRCDFSQHTIVPKLSGRATFSGVNGLCKIIVPDSLYDEWIAATNWSTYADYIYKASEEVTQ